MDYFLNRLNLTLKIICHNSPPKQDVYSAILLFGQDNIVILTKFFLILSHFIVLSYHQNRKKGITIESIYVTILSYRKSHH